MTEAHQVVSRWMDRVPDGAELDAASTVVSDDLVGDEGLRDLLGDVEPEVLDLFELRQQVPRIRPVLVALAARAAGAASVDGHAQHSAELLHLLLRVHDVALGQRGGRRRWVARKLARRSTGLLGSSQLSLRALELVRHGDPSLLGDVLDTLREFAEGQALSRELQAGTTPTGADWREHADTHTGALFSFCCRAGGKLAHASPTTVSLLARYGRHTGRLWHIAEDASVLAHGHTEEFLARALSGRPMFPVVAALSKQPDLASAWKRLIDAPAVPAARALAQRCAAESASEVRETMAREGWEARRIVQELPESRYRTALDALPAKLSRAPRT